MKVLTLWEPWATLMAIGAKRIETRSWCTRYRGRIAIHAAKTGLNQAPFQAILGDPLFCEALKDAVLSPGCIVAVVTLQTCWPTHLIDYAFPGILTEQERHFGKYEKGRYGWITSDVWRLPTPVRYTGHRGIHDLPRSVTLPGICPACDDPLLPDEDDTYAPFHVTCHYGADA